MEMVQVIFPDKTITAEMNGDSYIVDKKFEPGDLSVVKIKYSEGVKVFNNAEMMECASIDGRYWFAFREITQAEIDATQLRADVDYLLLITE